MQTQPNDGTAYMTKREMFASLTLQGLLSANQMPISSMPAVAVEVSDKLIAALNKEQNGTKPK